MRTIEKVSGRQAGSVLSLPDPARRQPAFSIVHTDREPGTGLEQATFVCIFRARATGKPDSAERDAAVTQHLDSHGDVVTAPPFNGWIY